MTASNDVLSTQSIAKASVARNSASSATAAVLSSQIQQARAVRQSQKLSCVLLLYSC